eukprot:jgi/Orpsp1_1/1175957/evm.model.c7180000055872.1
MKYIIGIPDYHDLTYEKLFKKIEMINFNLDDDYLEIYNNLDILNNKIHISKNFDKDYINIKGIPFLFPEATGAHYHASINAMSFYAGILNSPYYNINNPDYLNYGSLGYSIGHELTHDNDNEEFDELSQCLIDQYNNFTVKDKNGIEHNINAENSLTENIADQGGIVRAYEAWRKTIENDPENATERNKKLPGLSEYSIDQLFFIYFGQTWCSNEQTYEDIKESNYPPYKYRVNGVVSNLKQFSKAFNCPANSPMNPKNKCSIW